MKQIVFLATHWGTKYGGINAFNLDFCTAVAQIVPKETYQVACVVLKADKKTITQAKQTSVELVSLDIGKQEFEIPYAYQVKALLHEKSFDQVTWWIGHDVFSGPIALKLKEIHDSHPGRVALVHHMDFGAYKIFQQTGHDSHDAQLKIEHQQKIFKEADVVFGVGPYLQESARDLCGKPAISLTPGLIENVETSASSSLFNVITLGRLDPVNDVIKQLTLSVKALGKAYEQYKHLSEIVERPKMWIYGISEDADEFKKLLSIAEESAHARLPINAFPYKENRQEIWSHMRGCNLCLMPSLHEGFGLVGWEAIGLEVPVILSKHSGLFRLLYDMNAASYIQSIDITGIIEQDIEPLAQCISKVYFNKQEYKEKATALRQLLLDKGCTWENAARSFLEAIGISPGTIRAIADTNDISSSLDTSETSVSTAQQQFPPLSQPIVPFKPGSAPPMPPLIIGREDALAGLKSRLGITSTEQPSGVLQVLTAIRGWPGVGKTTIAAQLAHDFQVAQKFPDGILWVSLGPTPNLFSELATWGRALGTDDILRAETLEQAMAQLTALLRHKRMLLIVDDVWEQEHAVPFKVGGIGCAMLITTRVSSVAQALAPTPNAIYKLPILTEEQSLELLKALAPDVVSQHHEPCLELIDELEGLPLALQVAGHMLNVEMSYGFSVTDLLVELREGTKILEAKAPADRMDLANETTPTVAVLLQKSTDRLDEFTRDCFAYLGPFAPKPATFDLAAMQFVWEVDDPKPIARTLVDRGLLEFVQDMGRYQMHALLVMHAKSLLT